MDWLYELIRISVYGLIGFVLGTCWCGVCTRNKQIDQALNDHFKDIDETAKIRHKGGYDE